MQRRTVSPWDWRGEAGGAAVVLLGLGSGEVRSDSTVSAAGNFPLPGDHSWTRPNTQRRRDDFSRCTFDASEWCKFGKQIRARYDAAARKARRETGARAATRRLGVALAVRRAGETPIYRVMIVAV